MKSSADRRKAPRIPLLIRVECRTPQTYVLGHCENLSETGMLIFSKETFAAGSDVTLRFSLPPKPTGPVIQTDGMVARAQDGNFMAIQFARLQARHRIAIIEYVERSSSDPSLSMSSGTR